jgi:hypothetical protein
LIEFIEISQLDPACVIDNDVGVMVLAYDIHLIHEIAEFGGVVYYDLFDCVFLLIIDTPRVEDRSETPLADRFRPSEKFAKSPCFCQPRSNLRILPGAVEMTGVDESLGNDGRSQFQIVILVSNNLKQRVRF